MVQIRAKPHGLVIVAVDDKLRFGDYVDLEIPVRGHEADGVKDCHAVIRLFPDGADSFELHPHGIHGHALRECDRLAGRYVSYNDGGNVGILGGDVHQRREHFVEIVNQGGCASGETEKNEQKEQTA